MHPEELRKALNGIVAISVTPMTEKEALDERGLREHLRFLLSRGISKANSTIVVGGSTGECGQMSIAERKRLIEVAVDELGGKLPVIAGCNHSNIYDVIDLVKHAESVGAAGVMIVPLYYYTPTGEAIVQFYRTISENTELGIMLYNNVEVTGVDIPIWVLESLVEDSKVVGIKECTPIFTKMERDVRLVGDKITVVNGHGEFLEPFAALAGTGGFISSIANFAPQLTVEMWNARSSGDYKKAKAIRDRLTPYMDLASEASASGGEPKVLALLKRATDLVGSHGGPGRLPICPLTNEEEKSLCNALEAMRLI